MIEHNKSFKIISKIGGSQLERIKRLPENNQKDSNLKRTYKANERNKSKKRLIEAKIKKVGITFV